MPNTLVQAAATGLPNSRRAVLRSILAGAAVATVPAAGAIASIGHPDAGAYFAVEVPQPAKPEGAAFTNEEWFIEFKERMAGLRACPSPEAAAHVAACEAWAKEDERLRGESGQTAAEERDNEALDEVLALRDKIVATRATTLAGLKFKAKYAIEHYSGEPDEDVLASIADDILAMSGSGLGEAADV
jgi:hypothetical protein